MKRGEIHWANLSHGYGRRPVVVLTRDAVIEARGRLTIAPITRSQRGIPVEVGVGRREGLSTRSVVNADSLLTVPKSWVDPKPVGSLGPTKRLELDRVIRFALDIRS